MNLCLSLFCCAFLCVLSSFAIILKRKRELVDLHLLSYGCILTVDVLRLLLTVPRVPWVGLGCVVVVFSDHTLYFPPKYVHLNGLKLSGALKKFSITSRFLGSKMQKSTF